MYLHVSAKTDLASSGPSCGGGLHAGDHFSLCIFLLLPGVFISELFVCRLPSSVFSPWLLALEMALALRRRRLPMNSYFHQDFHLIDPRMGVGALLAVDVMLVGAYHISLSCAGNPRNSGSVVHIYGQVMYSITP